MNIAHTKTKPAQGVPFSGTVLVRRVAGLALIGLIACTGMSGAQAARYGDRDQDRQRNEQSDRRDRGQPSQRDAQREDEAREEQRRQQAQQDQNAQHNDRRSGRLTPDERRDLRRQINEAGIELYPRAPRR